MSPTKFNASKTELRPIWFNPHPTAITAMLYAVINLGTDCCSVKPVNVVRDLGGSPS